MTTDSYSTIDGITCHLQSVHTQPLYADYVEVSKKYQEYAYSDALDSLDGKVRSLTRDDMPCHHLPYVVAEGQNPDYLNVFVVCDSNYPDDASDRWLAVSFLSRGLVLDLSSRIGEILGGVSFDDLAHSIERSDPIHDHFGEHTL